MNFHVHMISGDVLTFESATSDANALLKELKPRDLFKRSAHQFLGPLRTVTLNPECVEWIEVDSVETPRNISFAGAPKVTLLSPKAFKDKVTVNKNALMTVAKTDVKQSVLVAFGIARFKSGSTIHLEIEAKVTSDLDRPGTSIKLFELPAVFVQKEGGGMLIVNPKNIAMWQVVPGLKKSVAFALSAQLVNLKSTNP